METSYQPTDRTTPTRYRERARYDRETVHSILDEALICHLGYIGAGRPVVLPTTHARLGETLYLHGSTGSGPMLAAKEAPSGLPVCGTATLVDALVLAIKPGGTHGYAPSHPEMLASFLIAGPGIRRNFDLGEIDMRSIAPTLVAWLGASLTTGDLPALDIAEPAKQ